jgi:PleD family two-component response regulator
MKPREEGVDFLDLDKGQNLIFKGIRFKSKGNDSIVRPVKREEVRCNLKRPLLQNMHGKEEQMENSQEEEVQ